MARYLKKRRKKYKNHNLFNIFRYILCLSIILLFIYIIIILKITNNTIIEKENINEIITYSFSSNSNINQLDKEWLHVIKNNKITKIENFSNGLSHKFKATFNSSHQVMIKLVERIGILSNSYDLLEWDDLPDKRKNTLSRGDRKYQGWAELAAFYLDRVMGFNKKPLITGFQITNKELYENDNSLHGWIIRIMPKFDIYVSIHAWVDGIHNSPPGDTYMKYLIREKTLYKKSLVSIEKCLSISDVLVFDVLIDDHDKKWDFNWKATKDNINLHWDSGLGWRHGPISLDSCLDILCGTSSWRETQDTEICTRISIFRNETIQYLRDHSPDKEYNMRLSTLWINEMKKDKLYPILRFGEFWDRTSKDLFAKKVKFSELTFIKGLDYRQSLLLSYIDSLIELYGEENVIYQ